MKTVITNLMNHINKEVKFAYIGITVLFALSGATSIMLLVYSINMKELNKAQTERIIELEKVAKWGNKG